jgi:hypothetical protein
VSHGGFQSPAFPIILILVGALLLFAGCVERKLFIKSDPPDASVYIDGRSKGKTPVCVDFNYYGHRQVELRLTGHRVKKETVEVDPPWYQYIILDFFFDVLWPGNLVDEHSFSFTLEPYTPGDLGEKAEILERADQLRYGEFTPTSDTDETESPEETTPEDTDNK